MSLPIKDLHLPGWVQDELYMQNIDDLTMLGKMTSAKLMAIPGIGLRGVSEILAAVINYVKEQDNE